MIRKLKRIDNFGIFNAFYWEKTLCDESGHAKNFQHINIIYGRNYSGKTTLSGIIRALETGKLSDKFEAPSFSVEFADGTILTQEVITGHNKKIRVFNEDFIRENLRFISNPDDSVEPFAILGDDNNKIENEIEAIEAELGSKEEGKETGLYAQRKIAFAKHDLAFKDHKKAYDDLEKKLGDKATGRDIGIKYKPERFGDQNYNIQKLKTDIGMVEDSSYKLPTDEQLAQCVKLISEKGLQPISEFNPPALKLKNLAIEAEALVTKKINMSDKIEELVKDAVLNHWANEGLRHHNGKRSKCAFCDNTVSDGRLKALEKHFDEESERLQENIDELINRINAEKSTVCSALFIEKNHFYSKFHDKLEKLCKTIKDADSKYVASLDTLTSQLESRKNDILNTKTFKNPTDASNELLAAWRLYESVRNESNSFTTSLTAEQKYAKERLRLKEVSDYLVTIGYKNLLSSINECSNKIEEANLEKKTIDGEIKKKETLIMSKKHELKDEEKGANKVNDYLNNYFGNPFLKLEAKKEEIAGEELKRIRFEVIRDGKKAYHLSEGECSLLAFCYFLAKLDDINTRNLKPIIWIDDPISSLDGNHIFFVYSLLNAEIVSAGNFEQLFVSTHNLDFLKYLMKLQGSYSDNDGKSKNYQKDYLFVVRKGMTASIEPMPHYLKKYVTEFNYLFHQILKCASIESVDDTNYTIFFNFANNARKFLEIYLYYKYPDQGCNENTLTLFFGNNKIPAVLASRINNEYSHLDGTFERGAMPIEAPEIQKAANLIVQCLKKDIDQYNALLKSIGEHDMAE